MRTVPWVITMLFLAVGIYLIGGGLVTVYQVRAEESRLRRAIEQVTLPGFHLVERTPAMTTRQIWKGWLVGHVPVMKDFLWWKPGQHLWMSATYRTDTTPTLVSTQYAARFHSPVLSTHVSGVHLTVFIRLGHVLPNRELESRPYPVSGSDPPPTHGTLVDMSASIPQPARPAYPTP